MPIQIQWQEEIKPLIVKAIEENPEWRFPTIRGIFYYLSDSLGIIPRTEYGYKKVDELVVELRKEGVIPFGSFKVMRGVNGDRAGLSLTPEQKVRNRFDWLVDLSSDYTLPMLWRQPYVVEHWVEKKGLFSTFDTLTREFGTNVRCTEGYSTWEFCNQAIQEIRRLYQEREGEKLVILFWSDADPSGMQLQRAVYEQLEHFGMDFELVRCGVTPEVRQRGYPSINPMFEGQVEEYGLPDSPKDRKTLNKIKRDPNIRRYVSEFGQTFCELDSFISLAPDQFLDTLKQATEKYIDDDILKERNEELKRRRDALEGAIDPYHDDLMSVRDNILEELDSLLGKEAD